MCPVRTLYAARNTLRPESEKKNTRSSALEKHTFPICRKHTHLRIASSNPRGNFVRWLAFRRPPPKSRAHIRVYIAGKDYFLIQS